MLLGGLPSLSIANILLGVFRIPLGEVIGYIILQTQRSKAITSQINTTFKLFHHLVGADNQVSFADGELTDTGKTMHLTTIFLAEKC